MYADSVPFNKDRTHMGMPFTTIRLSPTQELQVERTHRLTLSSPQWHLLRKVGHGCPQALDIYMSYDDEITECSSFAVWLKPGEVEVPNACLPASDNEAKEEPYDVFNFGLVIDPDGYFWYRGNMLDVKAATSRLLGIEKNSWRHGNYSSGEKPCGFVRTPPRKCIRNLSKFQSQLKSLQAALRFKGFTLYAPQFIKDIPQN